MEIILALVAVGLLVYLQTRYTSLNDKQDEFKVIIKKLEARIKKLELYQTDSENGKKAAFQKAPEKTEIPKVKVPDLPLIVTEQIKEEQKTEQKELVEEPSALAFLVTEEESAEVASSLTDEKPTEILSGVSEEKTPIEIPPKPESIAEPIKAKVYAHTSTPKPFIAKPPLVEKEKSEFWMKVEKQFVENWTGISGFILLAVWRIAEESA